MDTFSQDEILRFVAENDVKFIRLTFSDMRGSLKNIAIMPSELPRAFTYGIPVDAAGFSDCPEDLLLVPDGGTLSVLPWRPKSGRVVRFFCHIRRLDGTPYPGDLRAVLADGVRKMAADGYTCTIGTKSEFYLFDLDEEGRPTRRPHDRAGYLDVAPLDRCENTRREICLSLEEMGLAPQSSCHKYGPGQNEIDFACADAVTAADHMVHYKSTVKTIAAQNGLFASFMPRPLPGSYGSALTVILNVMKDSRNIFRLEDGALPAEGRSFIAGILAHIAEMTLFLDPTVNSYARLRHSGAPNEICWSFENRGPLVRIPGQVGIHPRIEVRSPDCCCDPYLSFRLLLAAGMDGIARGLTLSDTTRADGTAKPFDRLPDSLEAALVAARGSAFVAGVLPETVRESFFASTEQQLALYRAAEDKAQFEERYFWDN